jgi:zinc protease
MTRPRLALALILCGDVAASCRLPPPRPTAPLAAPPPSDESFRAHPPAPEPREPFVPPVGHVVTLRNQMGLLVVERHGTSMVAAELVARGGIGAFPREAPVAFQIMASTLMRGAAARSQHEVYDTMNARVIDVQTSAGDAWVSLRAEAVAPFFDTALELLRDIALHPSFPLPAVEMERQRELAQLPRDADDAHLIAERNLYRSVFGPSHPYTRLHESPGDSLAKLTRDDVVRVWQEAIDPARAILVVAGDVDEAQVRERVEALFGDWQSAPSARAPVPVPPASPIAARLVVVDRPGAPQASVFYGAPIAPIDSPQHLAVSIAGELLGGMRSSVLGRKLRDELGATWSGRARIEARSGAGLLWWEGSVARERTADTLTALESRLRELREQRPADDELAAAKALIARSLPRGLETVQGVRSAFARIAAYGLPGDSLQTLRARLDATSMDDVRAAVPEPSRMKAVVVGDLASLRAPLLALGWGAIEEHDANGNLIRTIAP